MKKIHKQEVLVEKLNNEEANQIQNIKQYIKIFSKFKFKNI